MHRRHDLDFVRVAVFPLLVPLVFGVLVLVPPQAYVWLNDMNGVKISLAEVFLHYLTFSPVQLPDGRSMTLFATEHLWYLIYLWCYTVILTLAVARYQRYVAPVAEWLGGQLSGPRLFVLPVAFLILIRLTLRPFFPPTLSLTTDWYSHALYLSAFLAGVCLARHEGFWKEIVRYRSAALILAVTCGAMLLLRRFTVLPEDRGYVDLAYSNLLIAMFRWYAIAAALGYARRYWTRAHPAVSYFNKAVLTFYVLHQTVMVLLAHWLNSMHLLKPEAFLPIAVLTLLICGLCYEAMRKAKLLIRQPLPAAA
jgi:hypothetical protein